MKVTKPAKPVITLGAIAMVGFVLGQTVIKAGGKEQAQKMTPRNICARTNN